MRIEAFWPEQTLSYNAGKDDFIPARNSGFRLRHALLFHLCVIQSITIEIARQLKRFKTHPIPCRNSRSLVSSCCIWPDYVFHLPVTAWPIVCSMLPEHIVRFNPNACLSLTFHQLRSHSAPRNFARFLYDRKMPQISLTFLFSIHSHFILPHLLSCHRPRKVTNSIPIPCDKFFQRHTPLFLSTSHLVHFCWFP